MQSVYDRIWVKVDKKWNDSVTTEGGVTFYQDTTYKPEEHVNTEGTVVSSPLKITRSHYPPGFADIVKDGDRLHFMYIAAMDPDAWVELDGKEYLLVDYFNAIAVERDGKMIPVGEYILIEPMDEGYLDSDVIIIPDHLKKKEGLKGMVIASNDPEAPEGTIVSYDEAGKYDMKIGNKKLYAAINSNLYFKHEQE